MNDRDRREFEIVVAATGAASGRMGSEVAVRWQGAEGETACFHLATDEGEAAGGGGRAPPPLAFLATALVGSLIGHIRAFARSMEIPIRDVRLEAQLRWHGRRVGALAHEARAGAIAILVEIDSDAPEGELLRLIAAAKQGCFVEQTIAGGVAIAHRLKRPGGGTTSL